MIGTHVAGLVISHDGHVRQLCAWCGVALIDEDLSNVMVPDEEPNKVFPTWPEGALVHFASGAQWTVEPAPSPPLDACLWIVPSDASSLDDRRCRSCGCTEFKPCVTGGVLPCHWVAPDLCSACA